MSETQPDVTTDAEATKEVRWMIDRLISAVRCSDYACIELYTDHILAALRQRDAALAESRQGMGKVREALADARAYMRHADDCSGGSDTCECGLSQATPRIDQALSALDQTAGEQQAVDCQHVYYKTGDADAPNAIKDSNGEVVLQMCRKCQRAESELTDTPCDAPTAERQSVAGVDVGEVVKAFSPLVKHVATLDRLVDDNVIMARGTGGWRFEVTAGQMRAAAALLAKLTRPEAATQSNSSMISNSSTADTVSVDRARLEEVLEPLAKAADHRGVKGKPFFHEACCGVSVWLIGRAASLLSEIRQSRSEGNPK